MPIVLWWLMIDKSFKTEGDGQVSGGGLLKSLPIVTEEIPEFLWLGRILIFKF